MNPICASGRVWAASSSALCALIMVSCSGGAGGSGSASFDSAGSLLSVTFPDPGDVNPEKEDLPPAAAPLVQQIRFEFDGKPDPDQVNDERIQVRSALGFPVPGRFDVLGTTVTFTPDLPTRPAERLSAVSFDNGGAGLDPLTGYTIRIGETTWPFVRSISEELLGYADPADPNGVVMNFGTTGKQSDFFKGFERVTPRLTSVSPIDGASGVTPQLYSDPGGLFPARGPFFMEFDAAVNPAAENLGAFLLVDMDDGSIGPAGLPLGFDVRIVENQVDRCLVEVMPSGVLPFGHLLSLEHPASLRSLSSLSNDPGTETVIACTFTTAEAPELVTDALVEGFDSKAREDFSVEALGLGQVPADWDVLDSDVLQAAFAFDGSGVLGKFAPDPPPAGEEPKLIIFDTSRQVFPLFDGSTPEAPQGYQVTGGVFSFTDIDIPDRVIIEARGPNPLVFTATGTVRIEGTVQLSGVNGTDENAFDSAMTSVPGGPGGAGGGRGGVGHPIVHFPAEDMSHLRLVSPPVGGRGWGPKNLSQTGGFGGQSGCRDRVDSNGNYGTDNESTCRELRNTHNNGWKPPGGGGGSFLKLGKAPKEDGVGNVICNGSGTYTVRPQGTNNWKLLLGGAPGPAIFVDADKSNDFFGIRGEHQAIHGGQGGGGGASGLDSYFCGSWCLVDANPNNNAVCSTVDWGFPPTFASSVGDSRGGSAGGGGGAFQVKALGDIVVSGRIDCHGGTGGGGEAVGCGNWAGGGGGGSGGLVALMSAGGIEIQAGAVLDVARGLGAGAVDTTNYIVSCNRNQSSPGSGGNGAAGIIQLQVPAGSEADVDDGAILTKGAWVDDKNMLNPAEFTPISVAVTDWYDMGRTITRGAPGTSPAYFFDGLDSTGYVLTDAEGNVQDPERTSIICDYLGQQDPQNPGQYLDGEDPCSDFIPPSSSVRVQFQGADAVAPGSKEVDPATITSWRPAPVTLMGSQFIRYRITFDISADGATLSPQTPRPAVQGITIAAEF